MLEREIRIFLAGMKLGREKRMAMDAGEHWITVNGGSRKDGDGGGSHVMIDGEGRIVAGMGGKYKGAKLEDLPRKHFINETAYQKRQSAAVAAGATAASGLYHKGKDGSEFYRYEGSPAGTAWRRKLDDAMSDPAYPAEREDYNAARKEADQKAQEAQHQYEQAAATAQQAAQENQGQPDQAAELEGLGLRRWQQGVHDRLYLPRGGAALDRQAATIFGLEVERRASGSISSAKLNGETISHSQAHAMILNLGAGAYYDNKAKKWVGVPSDLTPKYPSAPVTLTPEEQSAIKAERAQARESFREAPAQAQEAEAPAAVSAALREQTPAGQLGALGLKRWNKSGRDRFYLASPGTATKAEQMAQVLGLEIQRDGHRVTSAKIDGIDIANSRLRALNDALISNDQTYYDNVAGKWVGMPAGLEPKFPTAAAKAAPAEAKPAAEPVPAPVRIDTPPGASRVSASGGMVPETRSALPLAERQRVDLSPEEARAAADKIHTEWYSAPLKDGHAYMRIPVQISKESEKAVFTKDLWGSSYFDGNEATPRGGVWLPKSHCTIKDGRVIGVSPWIAVQKGIVPLGYYKSGSGLEQLKDQHKRDMDAVLTKRAIDSNDSITLSNIVQPSRDSPQILSGVISRWKEEDSGRDPGKAPKATEA